MSIKSKKKEATADNKAKEVVFYLRLYVAGQTPKSIVAITNLHKLCEQHLKDKYKIEIIDLLKKPHLAKGDQILVVPTLIRKIPEPVKRLLGDLSIEEKFLIGFDVKR